MENKVNLPGHEVALSMLNVYSTILLKAGLLTVIFDPVEIEVDKYSSLDLIVITHEHTDHFDKNLVLKLQKKTKAIVLTTPYVANHLAGLEGMVKALRPGDCFEIKDVSFHAERSNHIANEPLTFVIKTAAATIFHPSDSEYFPEMEVIRKNYKPELVIYMGSSKDNLRAISSVICPHAILSYAYPMLERDQLQNVKVVMLKRFDWYYYPSNKTIFGKG